MAALLASGPGIALAQEAPSWTLKFGMHDIAPKSHNGSLAGGTLEADVGDSVRPTAMAEYLFTPQLGLEVIAAWPFEHKVRLNGDRAAKVRQLPPTLSLQYHLNTGGAVSPYLGVGLNYTRFFSIKESGPLAGTHLSLGDSWGFAAHAGVDVALQERWFAGADVRWIDIDSKARVDGASVGSVTIDPVAFGLYVGYRF
jgi:outer membrane protein